MQSSRFRSALPAVPDGVAAAWLAVGLLTAIAFLLRISQLDQTLIGDEVSTYQDIFGHSFRSVLSTVHTGAENSPPLYFLLAWFTSKLGDPTVWIRVPSLIAGTLTVPVVYLIGRETIGRLGGVIAAGVLALTPFAVYYGIEARPYATMTFFVAVSTWALLRAVRTSSARWWVLYTLASAAAAYCHYTCAFVLGVQALWALWICRRRIWIPLAANAGVLVLYAPWIPHLRGKALLVIGALYPLGFHRVLTDLFRPFPGHPGVALGLIPTTAGLIAIGACGLAGAIALGLRWRGASPEMPGLPSRLWLLVALAAATPIGLLLYSLVVTDLWLPRGLSASLPATALVFGALLAALPRRLGALAVAATLITLVAGTLRSFDAIYARGPYRTIAQYLDRAARPDDPMVLVTFQAPSVEVEFKRRHRVVGLRRVWALTPPGGRAFVILDDILARGLKIPTPHPAGFRLVTHRRYPEDGDATEVLEYQRLAGNG